MKIKKYIDQPKDIKNCIERILLKNNLFPDFQELPGYQNKWSASTYGNQDYTFLVGLTSEYKTPCGKKAILSYGLYLINTENERAIKIEEIDMENYINGFLLS